MIAEATTAGNRRAASAFRFTVTPSRSRFLDLRRLRYHLREWGREGAPTLLMLHGWMDASASFQFVVDALRGDWHVIAPDWRGYGRTSWAPADCYWFPDYLADLDALLEALRPQGPVTLIGHSMGGNVALLYAGVRPQRVRAVVNLEGFGLRDAAAAEAPDRYARWLDELKAPPVLRTYATRDELAQRLRRNNPRLTGERARFLAEHWGEPKPDGGLRVAGDPAHRIVNPVLYRWAETEACWRRIVAPVLWVEGRHTDALKWAGDGHEIAHRRAVLATCQVETIDDAGHMLHHDQPERVAHLIEGFLAKLA